MPAGTGAGLHVSRGSVATNADTLIVPVPDIGMRAYVLWLTLTVSVAGTSSRAVVSLDNSSGAVLARLATVTADGLLNLTYVTADKNFPGNMLTRSDGTLGGLNLNTSGTGAATINYEVAYMVKG